MQLLRIKFKYILINSGINHVIEVDTVKEIPTLYKKKEECCGCTACYAICPQNAIMMVEDQEGFEYPVIDENKCICCLQCIVVCPFKIKG